MGAVAAALAMTASKVAMGVMGAAALAVLRVAVAQAMAKKAMAAPQTVAVSKVVVQARALAMSKRVVLAAMPPTRLNRLSLLRKNARALRKRSLKFSGSQVGYFFGMGGLSIWM